MPSYIDQSNYMHFKVLIRHIDDILKKLDKTENNNITSKLVYAVEQHKIYVENMLNMLDGKMEWVPPKHTQCTFGITYFSLDENHISKLHGEIALNEFRKLGKLHQEFHSIAEKIMNAIQQGQNKGINTLILELAAKSTMIVEQCSKLTLLCKEDTPKVTAQRMI